MAKSDDRSIDEPTADFPGLIDIVVNDADQRRLEFWFQGPTSTECFTARVSTGRVGPNDRPVILVPPPVDALPWAMPRRTEVVRLFEEDTNQGYFAALLTWITDNVDLPSRAVAVLLTAWVIHTYLIDLIADSPYIVLLGPPETGKTRALGACIHAARRGILTLSAREAALIRYAHDLHASVGLDPIDFMAQVRPMQDFFAARTTNDGTVTTRVLDFKVGPFKGIQHYRAFGATLVASNVALSEDWIASRALVIQACQASRQFLQPIDKSLALPLRERGTAFRGRILNSLDKDPLPTPERLATGRLGDMMAGLALAIQLTDPSYLPLLQELTGQFATARKAEVRDTLEVELLRSCIERVEQTSELQVAVKLQDLVYATNLDRSQDGERALSSRKVAPILRATFGIQTWTGTGNYTHVTLDRGHLAELAAHYGLQPPREHVNVQDGSDTSQSSETAATSTGS